MRPIRPLVTFLKICIALIVVCTVIGMWPKARLSVVWAAGRGEGCSFRDTLNSHELLLAEDRIANEIGAASHPIQEDPAGFELMQTPRGLFWTVKNDKFLRFTLAEQDLQIYGTEGGVQPGDVVLDCGANVGTFTRTALARGARLVVAIEPTPSTVESLRRNFASEIAAGRVIVYPKGVWDRVDTLDLAVGSDGNTTGNSFVFGRDLTTKVKVPLTTIDLLVAELNLPRVDFIKMDIEGAEKQALRGAADTIQKYRPRMAIASEHLPEDPGEIPKVVDAIWGGYQATASSCKDDFFSAPPEVILFRAR
jgi:FkbM family methyltransferase